MKAFQFENPVKVFFGAGVINDLPPLLAKDFSRVLPVVGKGLEHRQAALAQGLRQAGLDVSEAVLVDSNPHLATVRSGAKKCVDDGADVVVALGGGSAMDCAKMIAVSAAMGRDAKNYLWGQRIEATESLPTVMVPTIAATGTELNNTAVIRDTETKKKNSCAGAAMYPLYTFYDPELCLGIPPHITIWGAMDIVSHTLEYYLNGDDSTVQNRLSESFLFSAMELTRDISEKGIDAVRYGELMWTAALTWGSGLTKIGRGLPDMACHTIEEGIGAWLDTHHGAGLGILTPRWMRRVYRRCPAPFARLARRVFGIQALPDEAAALAGIERFEQWVAAVGAPQSYRTLCGAPVDEGTLRMLAAAIMEDSGGAVGRLVPLTETDVYEILASSCA